MHFRYIHLPRTRSSVQGLVRHYPGYVPRFWRQEPRDSLRSPLQRVLGFGHLFLDHILLFNHFFLDPHFLFRCPFLLGCLFFPNCRCTRRWCIILLQRNLDCTLRYRHRLCQGQRHLHLQPLLVHWCCKQDWCRQYCWCSRPFRFRPLEDDQRPSDMYNIKSVWRLLGFLSIVPVSCPLLLYMFPICH